MPSVLYAVEMEDVPKLIGSSSSGDTTGAGPAPPPVYRPNELAALARLVTKQGTDWINGAILRANLWDKQLMLIIITPCVAAYKLLDFFHLFGTQFLTTFPPERMGEEGENKYHSFSPIGIPIRKSILATVG